MDQVCLQGLKLAIRLNLEATAMSVDTIHILVATVFVSIWTAILFLVRSRHLDELRKPDPHDFY